MSFALCHLVGFQLVPRLRGLKDRKLYLFPGDTPPESLASLVGEPVNNERIKANWNDILRLVMTTRSGQVRPSTLWPSCPHPRLPLDADPARRRQAYEVLHYFELIVPYREMASWIYFIWNATPKALKATAGEHA
ncbi:Tn3 family transposase [Rhizobium tropici]|uniref:Tn3 family transposase n=1 Tax=Rhizobium tropici TaxID=398 RepID=A0A5B0VRR0_RHITR|nr:Tn3 family transposase [Rhizobium tropici]KAA1177164.1 Tn3 family transposase [Rhizobium tropici]